MGYEVKIATGPTSMLTDEARSEYEQLLDLLREDGIDGEIVERVATGSRGLTWVEITEICLGLKAADVTASWVIENTLDTVAGRVKEWAKRKMTRELAAHGKRNVRPKSITIHSHWGEQCRIDIGPDGKVVEYRWVKVEQLENEAEWWTTADIASYLGVQPATVSNYRRHAQMPAPDGKVEGTYVWRPSRILEWRPRPRTGRRP
jgi:hypothetical protein